MSAPASSEATTPLPAHARAARAEHRAAALAELLDICMDTARLVRRAVRTADTAADEGADIAQAVPLLAAACDQAARAVRRTALLAERLDDPASLPAPAPLVRSPADEHAAIKRRIIREVSDHIERQATDADEAETLHAEFDERLDAPDIDQDIGHRPPEHIILDIWRDLGLAHLATTAGDAEKIVHRRSAADIRTLCARAARTYGGTPPPDDPPPTNADRIIHLFATPPPQ